MNINPCRYSDFESFADAVARSAIAAMPNPSPYDGYNEARAKQAIINAALHEANEAARERWEAHVEHMEDLYERGVGPAWD